MAALSKCIIVYVVACGTSDPVRQEPDLILNTGSSLLLCETMGPSRSALRCLTDRILAGSSSSLAYLRSLYERMPRDANLPLIYDDPSLLSRQKPSQTTRLLFHHDLYKGWGGVLPAPHSDTSPE